MALIKCPECGNKISEFATHCIHCGCPMDKIRDLNSKKAKKTRFDEFSDAQKTLIKQVCDYIDKHPKKFIKTESPAFYGYKDKKDPNISISFVLLTKGLYVRFKFVNEQTKKKHSTKKRLATSTVKRVINYYNCTYLGGVSYINLRQDDIITLSNMLNDETDLIIEDKPKYQKPASKTKANKNSDYLSTLSIEDVSTISRFETLLKAKIPNLVIKVNAARVYYQVETGDQLSTLCWFYSANPGSYLLFKYYEKQNDVESIKILEPTACTIDDLINVATKAYVNGFGGKLIEELNSDNNELPRIYSLIIDAISGKKIKDKDEVAEVSKEVAEFAMKEVMHNAIESKNFEDENDFKKNHKIYRFSASLFGYTFSIKRVTPANAREIYEYFIVCKLVKIIKQNEKILNTRIIENEKLLVNGLKKGISLRNINYSLLEGILSTFAYISTNQLDDIYNHYISLI